MRSELPSYKSTTPSISIFLHNCCVRGVNLQAAEKKMAANKEAIELIKSASYEMQKPNDGFIALVMVSVYIQDGPGC